MSNWVLVFSDGTGQRGVREDGASRNSNIYRMHEAAKASKILSFYDPGLGAPEEGEPQWLTWGYNLLSKATGLGISRNIAQCYAALMEMAGTDAQIGLFGFSRGAYTVRCLGGVLSLLGLPEAFPGGNSKTAQDARLKIAQSAVEIYKLSPFDNKESVKRKQMAAHFKEQFACKDRWPHVVGVFDTVGALGIPVVTDVAGMIRHVFHDQKLNPNVKCGLQALSIDENRKVFKPVPWDNDPTGTERNLEQVWFPGVHSDIGGGYKDDRRLADATLAWMHSRLKALCNLDLGPTIKSVFDQQDLLGKAHNERTGLGVFWLEGDRTWNGKEKDIDGKLLTRAKDDSDLCQDIEHRFKHLKGYRPKPAEKHPRVGPYYP